jgi:hypothetical protein
VAIIAGLAVYGFVHPWSHSVYAIYAHAGRGWWLRQDAYAHPPPNIMGEPYRYSPLFTLLISPFALLPDNLGNALWRVFNCTIFAIGLHVWGRQALPTDWNRPQLEAFGLLVLPVAMHSMYNAQANLVMLGAILLAFAAVANANWNWAAGLVAAATLIKVYPIALALLLAFFWPRRFALRYVIAMVIGLALPFLTAPPFYVLGQYARWLSHLAESTGMQRERARSILHLFELYKSPLGRSTWLLVQLLSGLSVLGLCSRYRTRLNARSFGFAVLLLFCVWVVLFGPATESCTYAVMAPVAAWTLIDAFLRRGSLAGRIVALVSFLMMGPLVTDLTGKTVRNFANEHGCQPIGALLFLAYALAGFELRKRNSSVSVVSPKDTSLRAAA